MTVLHICNMPMVCDCRTYAVILSLIIYAWPCDYSARCKHSIAAFRVEWWYIFLCPLRPITVKLCLDCCRDQLLGSRSHQIRHLVSTRKINNFSRFHGGVSPLVGLLSSNNNSTRYAANLQTAQTPNSVIACAILPRQTTSLKSSIAL